MLNGLDLFSGIGGLTLALSEWVRPVAYCENDRYCQGVLLSRMSTGELPVAPIWDDIRYLEPKGDIDIIYGGFPCQDVSLAGARKGLDGERTGLFREAMRLVRECKPQFVFLENVPGIRKFVPTVRGELEALGYDCRDGFLSAAEVGANHIRNRWWLLAHANRDEGGVQHEPRSKCEAAPDPRNDGPQKSLADTSNSGLWDIEANCINCPSDGQRDSETRRSSGHYGWWSLEPDLGRVANGVPARVDRLRGLGNAVVPLQAREAFKRLAGVR